MSTTLRALRDSDGNVIDKNFTYARGTVRTVAFTSVAVGSSTAFATGTQFVELLATSFCYVRSVVSSSLATATSSDMPLAANERVIVPVGPNKFLGAVQFSAGGTLHATEL